MAGSAVAPVAANAATPAFLQPPVGVRTDEGRVQPLVGVRGDEKQLRRPVGVQADETRPYPPFDVTPSQASAAPAADADQPLRHSLSSAPQEDPPPKVEIRIGRVEIRAPERLSTPAAGLPARKSGGFGDYTLARRHLDRAYL
ncbi:MAG: hypothetical protein JOZ81_17570 [Chloroflexi bacterium]|nr:hypothetical protein [Chloroflexota bacterium]